MIISAGDGAVAAQAINCDLFEESLRNGTLMQKRERQIAGGRTRPEVLSQA
jgi:hypothetical protein